MLKIACLLSPVILPSFYNLLTFTNHVYYNVFGIFPLSFKFFQKFPYPHIFFSFHATKYLHKPGHLLIRETNIANFDAFRYSGLISSSKGISEDWTAERRNSWWYIFYENFFIWPVPHISQMFPGIGLPHFWLHVVFKILRGERKFKF